MASVRDGREASRVTILRHISRLSVVGTSDRDLEAEIERIYRDQYVSLCRVATGVTGRIDTAREAVQDGFARALGT